MTLVSGNIRFMRIFAGVPLGGSVKRHGGLSTTAIFGDLGGYVFENFRDLWVIPACDKSDAEL